MEILAQDSRMSQARLEMLGVPLLAAVPHLLDKTCHQLEYSYVLLHRHV